MLLTVWSGALEHDHVAPGLSSFQGHSSLRGFLWHGDQIPLRQDWAAEAARPIAPKLAQRMQMLARRGLTVAQLAHRFHRHHADVRAALAME